MFVLNKTNIWMFDLMFVYLIQEVGHLASSVYLLGGWSFSAKYLFKYLFYKQTFECLFTYSAAGRLASIYLDGWSFSAWCLFKYLFWKQTFRCLFWKQTLEININICLLGSWSFSVCLLNGWSFVYLLYSWSFSVNKSGLIF